MFAKLLVALMSSFIPLNVYYVAVMFILLLTVLLGGFLLERKRESAVKRNIHVLFAFVLMIRAPFTLF